MGAITLLIEILAAMFCSRFILLPAISQADDLESDLRNTIKTLSDHAAQERSQGEKNSAQQKARDGVQEIIAAVDEQTGSMQSSTDTVISHVKVNTGIPFPDPESVVFEPITPTAEVQGSSDSQSWRGIGDQTDRSPYRPARCDINTTQVVQRYPTGDKNKIVYDVLYVPEELVPLDPGEVYGLNTRLQPYGPKSGAGVYLRMKVDEIPCVPFRIRFTETHEYYDRGMNALKNYDAKPYGLGDMHPWVSEKVGHQR